MLPIYPASLIRLWDEFTIENEPITSVDLMERAAVAAVAWVTGNISTATPIRIVCGNGNNGGDGLAIARLLIHLNYKVFVHIQEGSTRSFDNTVNLERLSNYEFAKIADISDDGNIDPSTGVIIDCIFGTGLARPVTGFWKNVIDSINHSGCPVISIDIPSGLFSEPSEDGPTKPDEIVKANHILTFQVPKLSMLIAGWGNYCGKISILDIGLHEGFISKNPANHFFITQDDVKTRFIIREKFSHKGTYGHALIIAGNKGTCGAAVLSASACIKSGAGLVTVRTSKECETPINIDIPEVMTDQTSIIDTEKYNSIGIGPGIGIGEEQTELLFHLLKAKCPLILDADALNIISESKGKISIPPNSIITPHPKEFDRLAGKSANAYERFLKAKALAIDLQIIIVLKDAHTAIFCPNGNVYINSTGNPGMATAGSGDTLTGIITGLAAQGYSPQDAAILGVYCHGKAGDKAAAKGSMTGLIASDIIDNLDAVFGELEKETF